MLSSDDNTIGGTSPAQRNLISGNDAGGSSYRPRTAPSSGQLHRDRSQRNLRAAQRPRSQSRAVDERWSAEAPPARGTSSAATSVMASSSARLGARDRREFHRHGRHRHPALGSTLGVNVSGTDTLAIGGSGPGEGNLISGNGVGVYIYNASTARDRLRKPDRNGRDRHAPPRQRDRRADGQPRRRRPDRRNGRRRRQRHRLQHGGHPVQRSSGSRQHREPDSDPGNSIHDNEALGIDHNGNGPTPNDPGDADTGPNSLQNFPIIQSVVSGGSSVQILGKLDSAASTAYTLDFYANSACARFPRKLLEGETYLGSSQVTTDGSGHFDFDVTLPVATANGARISVTATDPSREHLRVLATGSFSR